MKEAHTWFNVIRVDVEACTWSSVIHAEVEAYMWCRGNTGKGITRSHCGEERRWKRATGLKQGEVGATRHSWRGMWGATRLQVRAMQGGGDGRRCRWVFTGKGLSALHMLLSVCSPRFHSYLEYPWSQAIPFVDSESQFWCFRIKFPLVGLLPPAFHKTPSHAEVSLPREENKHVLPRIYTKTDFLFIAAKIKLYFK